MSNKRRFLIILISVTLGSLVSFWIVKQRMGDLKPENYKQLVFNFIFAIAIVVGIGILLRKNNKKPE